MKTGGRPKPMVVLELVNTPPPKRGPRYSYRPLPGSGQSFKNAWSYHTFSVLKSPTTSMVSGSGMARGRVEVHRGGVGQGRKVEIDFASRFPPRHLETCRPEISKLDLGTIENGSAACDLPPEGPKKKSWADLTHLAHFADLAKISAQTCKKSVPGEGAPT